jgi:hypothetical protein
MGHFPRIRNHVLAVETAEAEFEQVRLGMAEELERRTDAAVAKLDDVPTILQARKLALKEIFVDYENVVQQFYSDVQEMLDAQDLLVGVIRLHTGSSVAETTSDVDYRGANEGIASRLDTFRKRIDDLLRRAEVSQAAIDRCRGEMINLGKRKRKELELECEALRDPPPTPAPRRDPPPNPDNVSWLNERRA